MLARSHFIDSAMHSFSANAAAVRPKVDQLAGVAPLLYRLARHVLDTADVAFMRSLEEENRRAIRPTSRAYRAPVYMRIEETITVPAGGEVSFPWGLGQRCKEIWELAAWMDTMSYSASASAKRMIR